MKKTRYLFGPVPSRRFGMSLGVDLTPYKTCSFDCIFCQLGRTVNKTLERKEYVPCEAVISEISAWLKSGGTADYITLSGSGEPTLYSRFGEILEFIRENSDIPSVLLTNGTMLHLKEVRDAAMSASIAKVSMSAWDQASYCWINRPHEKLEFSMLVEGITEFRRQFNGELWLEVFLVWGVNSTPSDVEKIAALADIIKPDRIHLNTAVRPPAEEFAEAVPDDRMASLCHLFRPEAEIITESKADKSGSVKANKENILSMLARRPCTMDHIANGFGLHINEVSKYIGSLIRSGAIREERQNSMVFYSAERIKK